MMHGRREHRSLDSLEDTLAELVLCLLLLGVGGLVWSLRHNTNPAVLWAWGWLVIGAVTALMTSVNAVAWVRVPAHLLSPLLPTFLLAGALAYTDRRVPTWLLPAGLGFGLLRGILGQSFPDGGHILSTLAEPAVEFAAAYLVFQVARAPEATPSQKILPYTFVVVAMLDAATSPTSRRGRSRNRCFSRGPWWGWSRSDSRSPRRATTPENAGATSSTRASERARLFSKANNASMRSLDTSAT